MERPQIFMKNSSDAQLRTEATIHPITDEEVPITLDVRPVPAAAAGLVQLWKEQQLHDAPFVFQRLQETQLPRQHIAFLLNKAVEQKKRRSRLHHFGQIDSWEYLSPPPYTPGIVQITVAGSLRRSYIMHKVSLPDPAPAVGTASGWCRYNFAAGWSALSVIILSEEGHEAKTITAIPSERYNEWLAFLTSLYDIHNALLNSKGIWRSVIQDMGGEDRLITTTFDDTALHQKAPHVTKIVTNYKWRHQKYAQKADASTITHLDLGGATRCGYRYTPTFCGKRSFWLQGEGSMETINCQRCLELIEQDTVAESHAEELPGRAGGKLLMAFRLRVQKTQGELAVDAQTIQGAIQGYECGSKVPSRTMLFRLSAALDLNAQEREQLFRAYGREQTCARTSTRSPKRAGEFLALPA